MADVIIKKGYENVSKMEHRCGEIIEVVSSTQQVLYYRALGHEVTECPGCLEVIEFQDLQNLNMIKELGWPD